MSTTTVEQQAKRLSAARVRIMKNPIWGAISPLLLSVPITARGMADMGGVGTAYTDGAKVDVCAEFAAALSDKGLVFLLLHEMLHIMWSHLHVYRWLNARNPELANAACDFRINDIIQQELAGIAEMPELGGAAIGLWDVKYRGWDEVRIFNALLKNGHPQLGEGRGLDEHGWAEAAANARGQSREQEVARRLIEMSAKAARDNLRQKLEGTSAGDALRDTVTKQAANDMRAVLEDFFTSTANGADYASYGRPSRRREVGSDGLLEPAYMSDSVDEIVVGVDTSGSIGGRELSLMLGHVEAAVSQVKIARLHLVYWDARVAAHEVYDNAATGLTASTKPKGGGGTDPTCLLRYMRETGLRPSCILMLTDGHVPAWGTGWPAPILWGIVDNERASPTCGARFHINSKELE